MIVGQTSGHAVVEDHAVFFAHQAVTGLAHVQLGPGVGVDAVEELACVRTLDVDLAEGRGVEDAHRVTHSETFAGHGGMQVFALLGEIPGAFPLTDVFKLGAILEVPGLHGGVTLGLEQLVGVRTGDRTEGNRRVVRPEHRGAHLGDADAHRMGSNGQTIDVAELALVSTEAQCGVTLDVLDRLEAFAGSDLDTGRGDIVLQVDKLLGRTLGGLVVRDLEQRDAGFLDALFGLRHAAADCLEAGLGSRCGARFEAVGECIAKGEHAIHCASAGALLEALARHKGQEVFTPDRATAKVRCQVHYRAVTAGAGDQIAIDHFALADDLVAGQVDGADARPGDPLAAARFDHRTAGENANATTTCFLDPGAMRVAACIGYRNHFMASVQPIEHRPVGVVIVGRQYQLAAGYYAVAAHVGGDRIGEHVAGHVVVRIHQRTLVSTRGQHYALGSNAVHALTYHPLTQGALGRDFTEVVGQTLMNGQEVVVVVAVHGGAWQQRHFRHFFQFSNHAGSPFSGGFAIQGLTGGEQAAAELFLFVGQDHACTTATGGQCRSQSSRASTDYQDIAMLVEVIVAVRIILRGRAAQTGGLTNVFLVGQPEVLWVHEGLVVEPGRHHPAADLAENAHQVGVHARPAVHAAGGQAWVQRLLSGTDVRDLRCFGATDLQHGIGLFGTGGNDAARTRVLEAAADHVDAIGQQGGGQAVTGVALVGLAIEGEGQGPVTVDAAALGKTIDLAHAFTPCSAAFFEASDASVTLGCSPIL